MNVDGMSFVMRELLCGIDDSELRVGESREMLA